MSDNEDKSIFGFAAVIGLPNAGKSTLINALTGSKVSIVSKKAQTTRSRIVGIVCKGNAQIALVDTPGLFKPRKKLEEFMQEAAESALKDNDAVLHVVDASNPRCFEKNQPIFGQLPTGRPCFLVLNKVDKIKKEALLKLAARFNDAFSYESTFMISALKAQGIDRVLYDLSRSLPEGPWMYEPEQISDMPLRFMAAEITREAIFEQLHDELPYEIFVSTDHWEPKENGQIHIMQTITTEKESQKKIIIGKGGSRLKSIGETARHQMQDLFEARIHLEVFVKVQKEWASRRDNWYWFGADNGR